jgi:hypothetical protein
MTSPAQLPPPPIFGVMGSDDAIGRPGIISLVDIFDEFLFAGDRSGQGGNQQSNAAGFTDKNVPASRESNIDEDDDGDEDSYDGDGFDEEGDGKKRKRSRGLQRNMTEEQKVERR